MFSLLLVVLLTFVACDPVVENFEAGTTTDYDSCYSFATEIIGSSSIETYYSGYTSYNGYGDACYSSAAYGLHHKGFWFHIGRCLVHVFPTIRW